MDEIRQKVEQYMPQIIDTLNRVEELKNLCAEKGMSQKQLHALAVQVYFRFYNTSKCSKLLDESILYTVDDLETDPHNDDKL